MLIIHVCHESNVHGIVIGGGSSGAPGACAPPPPPLPEPCLAINTDYMGFSI